MAAVQTFVAFLFVLGVLVFVHELGHFLAAKRVGIRVLKFQLGFNPTILSFRRGDTEYGIGALPLGGYVKMAGETGTTHPLYDGFYNHFNDSYNTGVTCTKANYPCR